MFYFFLVLIASTFSLIISHTVTPPQQSQLCSIAAPISSCLPSLWLMISSVPHPWSWAVWVVPFDAQHQVISRVTHFPLPCLAVFWSWPEVDIRCSCNWMVCTNVLCGLCTFGNTIFLRSYFVSNLLKSLAQSNYLSWFRNCTFYKPRFQFEQFRCSCTLNNVYSLSLEFCTLLALVVSFAPLDIDTFQFALFDVTAR